MITRNSMARSDGVKREAAKIKNYFLFLFLFDKTRKD